MRKKLTDTLVKRVKPPAQGRTEYFDALLPSFGLRVTDKGVKSWVVMYRLPGNPKLRRKTLGRLPVLELKDARHEAKEFLKNPIAYEEARQPKVEGLTFGMLAAEYIGRHAKRYKRTWREDERIIHKELTKWLKRPADTITRQDVIAQIERIVDRGAPYAANRTLAVVRKVFNWAVEKGLLNASPVVKIKPEPETERQRVLSEDQVFELWRAWKTLGYPYGPLFQFMLVTGQRRGEVAGMRWEDLDVENAVWSLPPASTKAKRSHQCPLSPLALEIIGTVPRFAESPFVFTSTGAAAVSGFSKAKRQSDELSGIDDWRLHDLRRTCGTKLAELGVADSTISRVLNHEEGGVTKIYKRYGYLPEKREAPELWAQRLRGIIADKSGAVVEICTRTGS